MKYAGVEFIDDMGDFIKLIPKKDGYAMQWVFKHGTAQGDMRYSDEEIEEHVRIGYMTPLNNDYYLTLFESQL